MKTLKTLMIASAIAMASSTANADYFGDEFGWSVGDNCGDTIALQIHIEANPADADRDMMWVDNYEFHTGLVENNDDDVDMIFNDIIPVKYESEEAFYRASI